MRYSSLILFFLLSSWLIGCGSTKSGMQDSAGQEFSWKTERIPANFALSSDSFAGSVTILYQVHAQCNGINCVPENAELIFSRQSSSNTLYLSDRNLSIQAGKERYEWKGIERTTIYETQRVGGIIKTVTLEWSEFVQISTAQKVNGNLSGEYFEWSYENREPLRTLLSKVESQN